MASEIVKTNNNVFLSITLTVCKTIAQVYIHMYDIKICVEHINMSKINVNALLSIQRRAWYSVDMFMFLNTEQQEY